MLSVIWVVGSLIDCAAIIPTISPGAIIDCLYEEGSYNIFTDKNKNIFNTNILRFSEHSGFIIFNNNIVDKIIVLNDYRTDDEDPTIFLPKNNIEALSVDYIFHTHPKSPELGSRLEYKLLYEFPSISDIYHFIDHHNRGILKGSLVITPEGLYIIRKYNILIIYIKKLN